jgi:DNA-binding CsgD family transcriptional regulator
MTETVTERDLRAVRDLVVEGQRADPTPGMPWVVLESLAALIACDKVSFPEADMVRGRPIVDQELDGSRRELLLHDTGGDNTPHFWRCVRAFEPCSYPARTGDLTTAIMWSDFYTRLQVRQIPLYVDYFDKVGQRNALHIAFPCAPGHMRKVSFWRSGGPDFDERDRMIAELVRPHLWEILSRSRRHLCGGPTLSPREWEVLRLADQGYGNAAIAQTLHISVATVRKHMEHIFDRTGVRTRSAAAALMLPRYHDSLAPPVGRRIRGHPRVHNPEFVTRAPPTRRP